MKKLILITLLLICATAEARYTHEEEIVDFTDASVPVLNEELRRLRNQTRSIHGVPSGGTTDQVLAKLTDDDYDTYWVDISSLIGDATPSLFKTFGGDGSDGAVTISADTNFSTIDNSTYPGTLQCTTLTINAGKVLTIDKAGLCPTANPKLGIAFIAVQGKCTIAGTISADGQGASFIANNGANATGWADATALTASQTLTTSSAPVPLSVGGAGGGQYYATPTRSYQGGGAGGQGAWYNVTTLQATPDFKINAANIAAFTGVGLRDILINSCGASGAGTGTSVLDVSGGGVIYIECDEFDANGGTLTADGNNGGDGGAGNYYGGGGGGTIIVRCKTLTNAGTVTVTGGTTASPGSDGAAGYSLIVDVG